MGGDTPSQLFHVIAPTDCAIFNACIPLALNALSVLAGGVLAEWCRLPYTAFFACQQNRDKNGIYIGYDTSGRQFVFGLSAGSETIQIKRDSDLFEKNRWVLRCAEASCV